MGEAFGIGILNSHFDAETLEGGGEHVSGHASK